LYKIEQILNVMRYFELLQKKLYTTLIDFDFNLDEVIFHQNNESTCKAKIL
jgi:hypothetical protein